MTPQDDPRLPAERYVQQHRDDLIKLVKHDDPFIRTLAIAMLYKGGQEAELEQVIRELELLKELDSDELPDKYRS